LLLAHKLRLRACSITRVSICVSAQLTKLSVVATLHLKFAAKLDMAFSMPKTRFNRKALKPVSALPSRPRPSRGKAREAQEAQQKEVRDYVAAMAAELAELAVGADLDSLAVACDVVREIAQGNVNSQSRQVEFLPVSRRN
jgi:hypothetical protein